MNIRTVPGIAWEGQADIQADSAFVQFTDPIYGIRAGVRILRSYQREGLTTLAQVIDRWAPPNENNSAAYVAAVCTQCGIEPAASVDFDALMPQLIDAIIRHENGEQIYTPQQIQQGIALASEQT